MKNLDRSISTEKISVAAAFNPLIILEDEDNEMKRINDRDRYYQGSESNSGIVNRPVLKSMLKRGVKKHK